MARKKFVTLTRRERAKYRQRLETIKSLRKELTEYKQSGERSLLGSRNTNRAIPDLLLPREHKKHLFESKEAFRKEMRELSKYKSRKEYYLVSYKRKFAELYKKEIIDEHLADKGEKVKPEGYFGTFTEEQMKQNKDVSQYMDVYNQIQKMSTEQFNRAYWEGFIVPFKFIYKDSINSSERNQHIQEQTEMLQQFKESGRMYER